MLGRGGIPLRLRGARAAGVALCCENNNAEACAAADGVRRGERSVPGTELALPACLPTLAFQLFSFFLSSPSQTLSSLLALLHTLHFTAAGFLLELSHFPLTASPFTLLSVLPLSLWPQRWPLSPSSPTKASCENREVLAEMLRQSGFLPCDSTLELSLVH